MKSRYRWQPVDEGAPMCTHHGCTHAAILQDGSLGWLCYFCAQRLCARYQVEERREGHGTDADRTL